MQKNQLFYALLCAILVCLFAYRPAFAEEDIIGSWQLPDGTIIRYDECGQDNYCGTVVTGEYKGQSIGSMGGHGGTYTGNVNKLDERRVYKGKASVKGNTLVLAGCVLGGLICKSENLTRK